MREDEFVMAFALVNDGDQAVNPGSDSWQLWVNGKPLDDWPGRFRSELRDHRWKELPAKDYITFGKNLARYFKAPGTYRVSWVGQDFRSAEIEFRVLPSKRERQRDSR